MPAKITVPHRVSGEELARIAVRVVDGPDAGRTLVSEEDTVTIGTAQGNDLVLSDETVSRHHLELTRAGDRIRARDLGSTNGTHFGGAILESALLSSGATLVLGRTTISAGDAGAVSVPMHREDRFGELLGRSASMRRLMARLERAAASSASVLLIGETGTGKELIANAIHEHSPRADQPLEMVDCATLLPTLVASELFGHEKGAFTGAERRHIGAFERANGGTLFLDEIGELPSALQPALLGALERKSFRRVGGNETVEVDVRVVAATHRDLRAQVNDGRFREDLYYRLAVVTLHVPPLRERTEDIPPLLAHFLEQVGFAGAVEDIFSDRAIEALATHHWPGNVRELRNYVEAAVVMGETPELESRAAAQAGTKSARSFDDLCGRPYVDSRTALLAEFEAAYLKALLARNGGNVSQAAREAEMNRSYLTRLLKRYGIR